MDDKQCWFCDQGIDQADLFAVHITVANLWIEEGEPVQYFFAHAACAERHLKGTRMEFDPSELLNPE